MKKILLGLIITCWSGFLLADELEIKQGHPDHYIVKKGDTLWDISGVFLDKPWRWPEIWKLNPQVKDPHWIYPGDDLALAYDANGRPYLTVNGGALKVDGSTGQNSLSPKVRTSDLNNAIPAIPLEKIAAFMSKSRVVEIEDLDSAPYVLASDSKRLISGPGDKVYARGNFPENEKLFGVFRYGVTYEDPVTREVLGYEAKEIGAVRLMALDADIATLLVNEVREELRVNDRLLTTEKTTLNSVFNPKEPANKVEGFIIHVESGVNTVGAMSVVAINLGENKGIEVGDVLAIFQTGEAVKDRVRNEIIRMPDTRAGLLMVFRTYNKMALALVLKADRPLSVGDKLRNP